MKVIVHLLDVVSIPLPDFFLLPLIAAEFFGLYCIAAACGLIPRADRKFILDVAAPLAYLVAIAVDMASHLPTPARPRVMTPAQSKSQPAHNACDVSSRKPRAQAVERGLVTHP
jgi:hypothetical protein